MPSQIGMFLLAGGGQSSALLLLWTVRQSSWQWTLLERSLRSPWISSMSIEPVDVSGWSLGGLEVAWHLVVPQILGLATWQPSFFWAGGSTWTECGMATPTKTARRTSCPQKIDVATFFSAELCFFLGVKTVRTVFGLQEEELLLLHHHQKLQLGINAGMLISVPSHWLSFLSLDQDEDVPRATKAEEAAATATTASASASASPASAFTKAWAATAEEAVDVKTSECRCLMESTLDHIKLDVLASHLVSRWQVASAQSLHVWLLGLRQLHWYGICVECIILGCVKSERAKITATAWGPLSWDSILRPRRLQGW